MFYSIAGEIVYADASSLAVESGGIAFRINTSLNTLKSSGGVGNDVRLFTYLSVREDAMELYGFISPRELDFFKMLMTVQNVGPKAALSILSVHTPDSLVFAVVSGDSKSISKAPGIGPKTAQRIILELKDKFSKIIPSEVGVSSVSAPVPETGGNISETVSALIALGYSSAEATKAVTGLDAQLPVEQLLKSALKKMM